MHQPQGFVSNRDEHKVCLLKKSIYGLKQLPQHWYKHFDKFMIKSRLMSSTYGSCVYFKRLEVGVLVFAIVSHITTTGKLCKLRSN